MIFKNKSGDVDIGRNIKMIEFLKCELLNTVALLFETLAKSVKENQEMLLECLANIILTTYSLGKRLGFDYKAIDRKVQEKAKLHIMEEHHLEKWFGELSDLNEYLKNHGK